MCNPPDVLLLDLSADGNPALPDAAARLGRLGWRAVGSRNLHALAAGLCFDLVVLHGAQDWVAGRHWAATLRCCAPMPVLALLPSPDPMDKVRLLELGADAVMHLPCDTGELVARVQALSRRAGSDQALPTESSLLRAWLMSAEGAGAWGLSASERLVLHALLDQPGRVMSRAELLGRTGLGRAGRHLNVVDLAVSRLRLKLASGGVQGQGIQTMRGQGYVWAADASGLPHACGSGRPEADQCSQAL